MEPVSTLAKVAGSFAVCAGFILLIPTAICQPYRRFWTWLTGSGVLVLILGIMITPHQPKGVAAPSQARPPAPRPAPAPAGDAAARIAFVAIHHAIRDVAKPCDEAADVFAKVALAGDRYGVYHAARAGEAACGQAAETVRYMRPPAGFNAPARRIVQRSLAMCEQVYARRREAMGKAMRAADDDDSSPTTSFDSSNAATGQASTRVCIDALTGASGALGIDAAQLQ